MNISFVAHTLIKKRFKVKNPTSSHSYNLFLFDENIIMSNLNSIYNTYIIFIVKVDHTRGKLYARVGWAKRQDGSLLAPPIDQWRQYNKHKSSVEPITEVFDKFGNIDPDKLETWLINHQIDPNDPR